MADRVAVLRDGRIVQYAAPQDLYARPADPALARFIGGANLLDGTLASTAPDVVDTILGRLERPGERAACDRRRAGDRPDPARAAGTAAA